MKKAKEIHNSWKGIRRSAGEMEPDTGRAKTIIFTLFSLAAFAANSVFCRLALSQATIDATGFTTIRLASGAVTLFLISKIFTKRSRTESRVSWLSAAMLFLYAITFSFAYIRLSAGTGALILFGAVQTTMIVSALKSGEQPHLLVWVGLFMALTGLVYLFLPGLSTPSPKGFALMATAGIAWGIYSILGRGTANPIPDTTHNFIRSLPFVVPIFLISFRSTHLSAEGIILAVLSGSLTSGLGYVCWYTALQGLTVTRAATVQLSVPVLAALGGVVFLSESISLRLFLSGIMILGGVGLSMVGREHITRRPRQLTP
jgi:drug/metabolite transporter (DMT)-like permease